MTKKDYIILAGAFRLALKDMGSDTMLLAAWRDCVRRVVNELKRDSNRFDPDKFLEACGYEESQLAR